MYSLCLSLLADEVVGQPEAVRAFARTWVRAMDGLFRPNRTVSVLLVAGPSGSGKAHLTETMARFLLGSERRVVKVNVSLFPEPPEFLNHFLSACLANDAEAPPAARPLRVVFIDSVEKAPPAVLDLLAHIFHTGEFTISPGFTVDFRRTIFVLETGVADEEIEETAERAVGFRGSGRDLRAQIDSRISEQIHERIDAAFSTRFLSLVDEVVPFRKVWGEDLPFILDKALSRIRRHLLPQGVGFHLDDAAREFILAEARAKLRFGAKGLRQAVDRRLQTPLLDILLTQPLPGGAVIFAKKSPEGISLFVPV